MITATIFLITKNIIVLHISEDNIHLFANYMEKGHPFSWYASEDAEYPECYINPAEIAFIQFATEENDA